MTVDKQGSLIYCHVRDKTFDINDYLLEQKVLLKSWRDVYWRVWGIINYRMCSRCHETFSCSELGHCKYHPEMPRFDTEEGMPPSSVGTYPCCHQKTLRFDPTQQTKVCYSSHCYNWVLYQGWNLWSVGGADLLTSITFHDAEIVCGQVWRKQISICE